MSGPLGSGGVVGVEGLGGMPIGALFPGSSIGWGGAIPGCSGGVRSGPGGGGRLGVSTGCPGGEAGGLGTFICGFLVSMQDNARGMNQFAG
jgi:hypothetical protein